MSYQYDLAGRVVQKSRENGTVTALGYDAVNQLLATVHYDAVPSVLESVTYGYDSVGRREYAEYAGDIGDRFGYDPIDQVTGVQYDVVDPEHSSGPGASYEQSEYDPMGNRLEFDDNGAVDVYEPNNLNQYAEIDDTALSYDLNGNLTEDNSGKVYTWDGENRLLSVQAESPTNGDMRVEYAYDAGSRRVKAVDYARVGGLWSVVRSRFFIYDAWNVLEEHHYDGASQLIGTRYYTWGSDLSGSMQGAGGIGGLLMTEDTVGTNAVYYHHYDGNGNVILLSDHTGTASASYRYAAFGRTRYAAGPHASLNPYRFSTKPVEDTTGLYYYGYRFYDAEMGRWISRDPIGEEGGQNLYVLTHNSPVSFQDSLGLQSKGNCCCCCPEYLYVEDEGVTPSYSLHRWSHGVDVGMHMAWIDVGEPMDNGACRLEWSEGILFYFEGGRELYVPFEPIYPSGRGDGSKTFKPWEDREKNPGCPSDQSVHLRDSITSQTAYYKMVWVKVELSASSDCEPFCPQDKLELCFQFGLRLVGDLKNKRYEGPFAVFKCSELSSRLPQRRR